MKPGATREFQLRNGLTLAGKSPAERFTNDPKALRFPEDCERLQSKFELSIERRVSADHVVSIGSVDYDMPCGYAGTKVTLHRKLLDKTIGFVK